MKKLLLVLLAFLAVFTYLRTFDVVEAEEKPTEIPVEIAR